MTPDTDDSDDDSYSYVEYTGEDSTGAMIYDEDSDDAWIESDVTVSLGVDEGDDGPRSGTRFDAETGTYHVEYDWRDAMPLSMIVVMIVADLEGVDPTELDPLYDCLDPELLDRLFSPRPDGTLAAGEIAFTYQGYEITVYRHGHVGIRPVERAPGRRA